MYRLEALYRNCKGLWISLLTMFTNIQYISTKLLLGHIKIGTLTVYHHLTWLFVSISHSDNREVVRYIGVVQYALLLRWRVHFNYAYYLYVRQISVANDISRIWKCYTHSIRHTTCMNAAHAYKKLVNPQSFFSLWAHLFFSEQTFRVCSTCLKKFEEMYSTKS